MRKLIKRVQRWQVQVYQDHVATPAVYGVYATSSFDARLLAFALDHGYSVAMTTMTPEHVDHALTYTKVVK